MFFNAPYIDFHTHHSTLRGDIIEVVSCHKMTPDKGPYYTLGFHPWWQNTALDNEDINALKDKFLWDSYCLGIGECGLDKVKGPDFDLQLTVFQDQLIVAKELNAPVIIHSVKSFNEILSIRNSFLGQRWCIHGFMHSIQVAQQLLDKGIYLSVAPDHNWTQKKSDLLRFLPVDMIFIESDGRNTMSIEERYWAVAQAKNLDIEELKLTLFNNFKTFFGTKWIHPIG